MATRASAASSSSAPAPAVGAADATRQEALGLLTTIRKRVADGAPVDDAAAIKQKLRHQRGMLDKKASRHSLRFLKSVPTAADGNDPTTQAPKRDDKEGITASAHGWRSLQNACKEAWSIDDEEASELMRGWEQSDVSSTDEWDDASLRRDARKLLRRRVKQAEAAKAAGGPWLRVLWLGILPDVLVQLRLQPSRMLASFRDCANSHFEDGGILEGVLCTPRDDGHHSCSRMLTETFDGRNIRRVDVKRGGATVASFYLAVFGHPGGRKRADTAADIEVPAQLLRDLFDGVTHMDALEIDADAL